MLIVATWAFRRFRLDYPQTQMLCASQRPRGPEIYATHNALSIRAWFCTLPPDPCKVMHYTTQPSISKADIVVSEIEVIKAKQEFTGNFYLSVKTDHQVLTRQQPHALVAQEDRVVPCHQYN